MIDWDENKNEIKTNVFSSTQIKIKMKPFFMYKDVERDQM